jgi:hypothetical protein
MAEQPDHVFKTKSNQTKYLSVWFQFRFGFFEFDLVFIKPNPNQIQIPEFDKEPYQKLPKPSRAQDFIPSKQRASTTTQQ